MPRRPCSVCTHADRQAIEQALLGPAANKTQLAKQYDLSRFAILDHQQKHMGLGCVEAEPAYESPKLRARNCELTEKVNQLHNEAILCPATNVAMVQLIRKLTRLMIDLTEEVI